ncbi:hypothetical protein EDC04DRAFT_2896199 [Pisolithus marmoratus]|nr:hypothetical protein EDC04DRAFT_2896199 [Pisolithus marmoratus]
MYGRKRFGILFTSASIRGRDITVCVIAASDDGNTYFALKTSWQDVTRAEDQAVVLKRLSDPGPHLNVIIPSRRLMLSPCNELLMIIDSRLFDSMAKDGRADSSLGPIRALLDDEMQQLQVENCGGHHQYLCEIGIVHRDISVNNIVLSLCRGGLGTLIDFDMAIVGRPNMHKDSPPPPRILKEIPASLVQLSSPSPANDKPYKAQRTASSPSYHT